MEIVIRLLSKCLQTHSHHRVTPHDEWLCSPYRSSNLAAHQELPANKDQWHSCEVCHSRGWCVHTCTISALLDHFWLNVHQKAYQIKNQDLCEMIQKVLQPTMYHNSPLIRPTCKALLKLPHAFISSFVRGDCFCKRDALSVIKR